MNDLVILERAEISSGAASKISLAMGKAAENWELIDRQELSSVIQEIASLTIKMSAKNSVELSKLLIGSYPRHMVDDAAVYSRGIVSVLENYPPFVGARAIDELTLKSKFMPTRAELNDHCLIHMNKIRSSMHIANMMLKEHDRRDAEASMRLEREKSREEFRLKHGDKSPLEVLADEGVSIPTTKRKEK